MRLYRYPQIQPHVQNLSGCDGGCEKRTVPPSGDGTGHFRQLPEYSTELYIHKKMKTTEEIALSSLKLVLPVLEKQEKWDNDSLYEKLMELAKENGLKNGQILWPVRTALSGKPSSPGGATELAVILGKEETLKRISTGIELLEK